MKEPKAASAVELPEPGKRLETDESEKGDTGAAGYCSRFETLLSSRVSGASLALFRIAFGIIMALEAWSLCQPNPSAITQGTSPLETYYTGSNIHFHFPFAWFDWLPLFAPGLIYFIVGLMAVGGILTALGLFYRAGSITLFLAWSYLFTVESTRTYWQSHYYLELLTSFLLLWMPAANCFSLNAKWRRLEGTVPFWCVFLLRGQLVIAYFYAGIAKLNVDWLLDAVPLRWFLARPDVIEPFHGMLPDGIFAAFTRFVHSTGFAYFLSYTGLVFDLAIGFLFLFRRTRFFALVLMVIFHLTNHFLIFDDIGWFPLLGLATATIFFAPEWPIRFWKWMRKPRFTVPDWRWFIGGGLLFPIVGAALGWKSRKSEIVKRNGSIARATAGLAVAWLAFQAILPLRHYAIAGDGRFTYEGLSFSWRLKADAHHAFPARIYLEDSGLINGTHGIRWDQWHGERVLYHEMDAGQISWEKMPEILIVADSLTGERIIANPNRGLGEAMGGDQLIGFWRETYGREPRSIRKCAPASVILESLAGSLREGGGTAEADQVSNLAKAARQAESGGLDADALRELDERMSGILFEFEQRDPSGQIRGLLNEIQPFPFQAGPQRFLVIDDPALIHGEGERQKVDRVLWQSPNKGGMKAMEIYVPTLESISPALPDAVLVQRQSRSIPEVYWNIQKDVTISKGIHISNQAFYLQRYARRVARRWEVEHGRRPKVRAVTAVSFNGRPHQLLVDPEADLASVPVHWFRHNDWIKNLEVKRIPQSALDSGTRYVGER